MRSTALVCDVHGLTYDFRSRTGRLIMAEGNCCDMEGCIDLFQRIDPKVKKIQTFAGDRIDTAYIRGNVGWRANSS